MSNGKLYIAISGANEVSVVDAVYHTTVDSIPTSEKPYKLAIGDNQVFYYNYYDTLYAVNLSDFTESMISSWDYYQPDLAVDKANHVLYVAASTSPGDIGTFDTLTHQELPNHSDSRGTLVAAGNVILDGDDAFFAGRKLDKNNLAINHGDYESEVFYVKGDYVFTKNTIKDRNTYLTIGNLPYESKYIFMDSSDTVYLFHPSTQSIDTYSLSSLLNTPSITYSSNNNILTIPDKVSAMAYDNNGNQLLVTLEDQNKLLYIDGPTLNVSHELVIGSRPADIQIVNENNVDRVYVPLSGATKIAVANAAYDGIVSNLIVDSSSYRIQVGTDKIYYVGKDSLQNLRAYDRMTQTAGSLSRETYYEPEIILDEENGIIYVGGSSDRTFMFAVSTSDYTQIDQTADNDGWGFPASERRLVKSGNDLYYATFRIDAADLLNVKGTYNEAVIFVNGNYVFTPNAVYDKDTYQKLFDLPFTIDLATMASDGTMFLYSSANNGIYRYNSVDDISIPVESSPGSADTEASPGGDTTPSTDTNTGGTTPSTGTNTGGTEPDSTSTDTNDEGQAAASTTIDDQQMEELINNALNESAGTRKIIVDVDSQGDVIETQFNSASLMKLSNEGVKSIVAVITQNGTLEIPTETLKQALEDLNIDVMNAKVTVTVQKMDPATQNLLDEAMSRLQAEPITQPVDFTISVTQQDGSKMEITSFSSYLAKTLDLPQKVIDDSQFGYFAGIIYDRERNSYFPIPTIFKNVDGIISATFYRQGNSIYTVVKHKQEFKDVPDTHYAKKDIEILASKFVVSGYEDGQYHPERNITRAEFATLLIRALGILPDDKEPAAFNDVKPEDWYAANIASAVKAGLVNGYEDGSFRPNQNITRQEMIAMMVNALKVGGYDKTLTPQEKEEVLSKFKDKDSIPDWAKDAAAIAVKEGIMNGIDQQTFSPNTIADRGQSAVVLYRMIKNLGFIN